MVVMLNNGEIKAVLAGASVAGFFAANFSYLIKTGDEEVMKNTSFYAAIGALHAIISVLVVIFYAVDLAIVSTILGAGVSIFWTVMMLIGYHREDVKVKMIEEELKK